MHRKECRVNVFKIRVILRVALLLLFAHQVHDWLSATPCTAAQPGSPVLHDPWVCSNSHPLSWWCHLIISASAAPFSCPQPFPASGSFSMSQLFASGGQGTGASTSAASLPVNIQGWFPNSWLIWSSCSPGDSKKSSPVPEFKSINFSVLNLLDGPTRTSVRDYGKNHSFDYMDLCLCFLICHLGSKEQVSFNFTAAVTVYCAFARLSK